MQLAFMEKSKLTTVTNVTVGPQIATDGYICSFTGLKAVSYTHLDLYKRQIPMVQLWLFLDARLNTMKRKL